MSRTILVDEDGKQVDTPILRPQRLNVGCHTYAAPGWTNLDRHAHPGVDVIANIADGLKWIQDGCVDLVYCGHVLEHLTYEDELPRALATIKRVLKTDGLLMVVGPDADRGSAYGPEQMAAIWPGHDTDVPGGRHQWKPTVEAHVDALGRAGFTAQEVPVVQVPPPWPIVSRIGWQLALQCSITVDPPA